MYVFIMLCMLMSLTTLFKKTGSKDAKAKVQKNRNNFCLNIEQMCVSNYNKSF